MAPRYSTANGRSAPLPTHPRDESEHCLHDFQPRVRRRWHSNARIRNGREHIGAPVLGIGGGMAMTAINSGNHQDKPITTLHNPQVQLDHLQAVQPHKHGRGHETLKSCIRQALEQGDGRGSGSDGPAKESGKSSYPPPPSPANK